MKLGQCRQCNNELGTLHKMEPLRKGEAPTPGGVYYVACTTCHLPHMDNAYQTELDAGAAVRRAAKGTAPKTVARTLTMVNEFSELMIRCTTLERRATAQDAEIASLKSKVAALDSNGRSMRKGA